jgi:hypothetical protein
VKLFRDDPEWSWLTHILGLLAVLTPFLVYAYFGGDLAGY